MILKKYQEKKVLDAYAVLQTPCFVTDTGFYIDNYPNNPGYQCGSEKKYKMCCGK